MSTPNTFANLEAIMNNARSIVNDTYNDGAGEIFTDTAPFTINYINSSLLELQDRLENNAVVALTVDNYIVSGLEAVPTHSTSVQTSLGFDGYSGYTLTFPITQVQVATNVVTVTGTFTGLKPTMPVAVSGLSTATYLNGITLTVATTDGATFFTAVFDHADSGPTSDTGVGTNNLDPTITLPLDMSSPQFLWERATGTNNLFKPMHQPEEGIQPQNQTNSLRQWEWRGNAIWFLGATTLRDIRIRYIKVEANVVAGTDFTTINIDLPGSFNALSYMLAFRYVQSRNPETAPMMKLESEKYIREIIKRTVREKQGIQYQRPPYGGRENRGRGNWGF